MSKATKFRRIAITATALAALVLAGCATDTDADVASKNLSKAADQFEINRRIVFFNGITDTYLLTIEGRCSIDDNSKQVKVTCKTGSDSYKKHYLGLSDNVSYIAEQLEGANVSTDHYRVIFKPSTILPDVEVK
ncbi:hypothetical protein [Prescottella agglutinans]|uniref:Lipoprotein n=1 Tax=Prescottella agglutinans TaxID=1644129 RepID=A0ABT6MEV4_9NOCA|nr:hypothetical protein [Prescottella agglutinans]MDH6282853.1 hypothetical protein [Prescottella agglutinans]